MIASVASDPTYRPEATPTTSQLQALQGSFRTLELKRGLKPGTEGA